jgi:hypothetical protein
MIKPTVGRVVWFYKYSPGQGHKGPLAAHVAKVIDDSHVNLMVVDEDGNPRPEKNVYLKQGVEDLASDYCEWMPYQKGQAAKTEQAETTLERVQNAAKQGFYGKTEKTA